IKPLLLKARERFRRLGLRNIITAHSDGGVGLARYAPFDGIISTAAPQRVPEELLEQLSPDGVLVIPVGGEREQQLRVIQRVGSSDRFDIKNIIPVRFVPLLGGLAR
ncbi:MAG: protein-L-isoaspartate O-methyltransferase, partial [Bacteroidales bacterium]|nr:protein-L-isoaspartate O-methyltransferase [Bacteroidales bacterium]